MDEEICMYIFDNELIHETNICSITDGNCFKVDTLETYARHVDTLRKSETLTPGKHITCYVFK